MGTYITGVTYDWSTRKEFASGSDIWPITWADNNHQYTSWGDGGGLEGDNTNGRVSLGFARVEDDHYNYTYHNIWGGYKTDNPAQFEGKSC